MSSYLSRNRIPAAGAVLLSLLPLFVACGGEGESAQAQESPQDSVIGAILDAVAQDQGVMAPRPTSPRLSSAEQAQRPLQIANMGYNYGTSEAPVKVMEISDFGCGYCRRFTEETFPRLKELYVDAGLVEWKFIPFVLGMFPNGLEAATAGECAGEQDKFFVMKARLFGTQSGWRNSDDPYTFFSNLASEEGLDVDRFNQCVQGGWRDNQIMNNIRLGQQTGVRGTPLFLVDGRQIPGALPFEDFRVILDAALLQKGVTPPPQ
jgi:protein-disulfide isomerase